MLHAHKLPTRWHARAVEVDGNWRVLAPDFLERVFSAVLDVIVEKDWPLDKVPVRALEAELRDEDSRAVRHSVALHSVSVSSSQSAPLDTADTATASMVGAQDEMWALDGELVCQAQVPLDIDFDALDITFRDVGVRAPGHPIECKVPE